MKDLSGWLNEGNQKKQSRFINHRLGIGEEIVGIYKGARRAKNKFGRTFHYLFYNEPQEDLIFDSNNPKIAESFSCIPPRSRMSIKKVPQNGGFFYRVKLLNTLRDEEELAKAAKGYQRERFQGTPPRRLQLGSLLTLSSVSGRENRNGLQGRLW